MHHLLGAAIEQDDALLQSFQRLWGRGREGLHVGGEGYPQKNQNVLDLRAAQLLRWRVLAQKSYAAAFVQFHL